MKAQELVTYVSRRAAQVLKVEQDAILATNHAAIAKVSQDPDVKALLAQLEALGATPSTINDVLGLEGVSARAKAYGWVELDLTSANYRHGIQVSRHLWVQWERWEVVLQTAADNTTARAWKEMQPAVERLAEEAKKATAIDQIVYATRAFIDALP